MPSSPDNWNKLLLLRYISALSSFVKSSVIAVVAIGSQGFRSSPPTFLAPLSGSSFPTCCRWPWPEHRMGKHRHDWGLRKQQRQFDIEIQARNTCVTIELMSPALVGRRMVLDSLARLEKALTYCSATVSEAAAFPFCRMQKKKTDQKEQKSTTECDLIKKTQSGVHLLRQSLRQNADGLRFRLCF